MQLNRVEGLEEGAELNWAALFSLDGSIYLYQILHIKGSYGGTDLFDATKKPNNVGFSIMTPLTTHLSAFRLQGRRGGATEN